LQRDDQIIYKFILSPECTDDYTVIIDNTYNNDNYYLPFMKAIQSLENDA